MSILKLHLTEIHLDLSTAVNTCLYNSLPLFCPCCLLRSQVMIVNLYQGISLKKQGDL